MTDNEIIKALEEWIKALKDDYKRLQALDAPMDCYEESHIDNIRILSNALDIINRQKAEIERLRAECGNQSTLWSQHYESIFETAKETIKAEAVKEFAEKYERYLLSQLTTAPLDKKEWINFCLDELDKLRKEMAGEDNAPCN